jgi:hypothetical protein
MKRSCGLDKNASRQARTLAPVLLAEKTRQHIAAAKPQRIFFHPDFQETSASITVGPRI